jgi:hypothetical protein
MQPEPKTSVPCSLLLTSTAIAGTCVSVCVCVRAPARVVGGRNEYFQSYSMLHY